MVVTVDAQIKKGEENKVYDPNSIVHILKRLFQIHYLLYEKISVLGFNIIYMFNLGEKFAVFAEKPESITILAI